MKRFPGDRPGEEDRWKTQPFGEIQPRFRSLEAGSVPSCPGPFPTDPERHLPCARNTVRVQ